MWYFILKSIMLIGVCGLLNYSIFKAQHTTKVDGYICGLITALSVSVLIAVWIIGFNPTPTALDVYRGNTELEITSVNGVPTDTVVVFKNNIH